LKKELVQKLQVAETQARESELEATISHLRAELKEKSGIIGKFQKSRGGQIELARQISESVKALTPIDPILYTPKNPSQSEVALVENLSDLHVGELIRPAETGGFGAFNYSIAQKRMKVHEENILNWTFVNRLGYNIPDLHIFGIGDYISGDIHQELLVTNEFPLPGQVARAASLIAHHIRNLAPHFRSVTFHGVGADNHGRLQKKPQAKQKAANNMSFLVHSLVEAHLRDLPNFKMIQYEDMAPLIEVNNHQFIVTHGDTVKTVQGLPWYGLERYLAKEALRRMKSGGFDYANVGHYHTPLYLPKLLMNGSLSGTTEYDHSAGRFGPPSQITYLVHRKHGVFNFTAWKFEIETEETK
jgi:hypothetical protein